MRWSIRLGSLFGIPVYLHFTFLLLLGVLALTRLVQAGLAASLGTVILIASVFGLVVLHEMGHALAARQFGIGTRDVTLLPIGGVARLERLPASPRQELWVALAGPAVNLALAGLIGAGWLLVALGGGPGPVLGAFAAQLFAINIGLFLFNMLPAFPMDGGRVLRAVLAQRMGNVQATEVAATVGKGMAVLMAVAGLFFNPMLLFIAVFVWFGADQERMLARSRPSVGWSPYGGAAVSEPAIRSWSTVEPHSWQVQRDGRSLRIDRTRPGYVRVWVSRHPRED